MRALGWILTGFAVSAILNALRIAVVLLQLYGNLRRMQRYSDPHNRMPLECGPWSAVFGNPGFIGFLGTGIILGVVGGLLLMYF